MYQSLMFPPLHFFCRHSGAREARTRNLEVPGSLRAPERFSQRSSLSATTARNRANRSSRPAQSGAGSARDRAAMAWKLSVSAASGALARRRSAMLSKEFSRELFKPLLPIRRFAAVLLPQAGGLWNFWQVQGKSAGIRVHSLS
jgi:hypothetical protein